MHISNAIILVRSLPLSILTFLANIYKETIWGPLRNVSDWFDCSKKTFHYQSALFSMYISPKNQLLPPIKTLKVRKSRHTSNNQSGSKIFLEILEKIQISNSQCRTKLFVTLKPVCWVFVFSKANYP